MESVLHIYFMMKNGMQFLCYFRVDIGQSYPSCLHRTMILICCGKLTKTT